MRNLALCGTTMIIGAIFGWLFGWYGLLPALPIGALLGIFWSTIWPAKRERPRDWPHRQNCE
jgi:predicted PurR-regulated permease PerM